MGEGEQRVLGYASREERPSAVSKLRGRPSTGVMVFVTLVVGWDVWNARLVGGSNAICLLLPLLGLMGFFCLMRFVLAAVTRDPSLRESRGRWLVLAVLFLVSLSVRLYPWLVYAGWYVSRPMLQRQVTAALAGGTPTGWTGVYPVRNSWLREDGCVVLQTHSMGFFDTGGFLFAPAGTTPAPALNEDVWPLGGGWYAWNFYD